jgi:hypothetical protein
MFVTMLSGAEGVFTGFATIFAYSYISTLELAPELKPRKPAVS